ncbi:hypothetical protein RHMOL_Rhmol12G0105400 [Rhododendron molle]|uniref:Uncharacterized protein n=1 Tax=Rhododendron molle TaxID=49168 RepID=A0ACC0LH01_RHOML|nr:hypothetical protein RHMOL_Rhmol12G0105400 [Rhododendron molle]
MGVTAGEEGSLGGSRPGLRFRWESLWRRWSGGEDSNRGGLGFWQRGRSRVSAGGDCGRGVVRLGGGGGGWTSAGGCRREGCRPEGLWQRHRKSIRAVELLLFGRELGGGSSARLILWRHDKPEYCDFVESFFEFRAPYLGGGDKLWHLVGADVEIGKVVDKPLLGYKEVSAEEGCFISPGSVLRFQVERGEFPHCLSAYRNYVVPPTAFSTWADEILGDANFVELLRKADIHRAVVNSLRLVVLRERKWMDVVVSRWSTNSHTLPVVWGATGPTLEDVGCLLRLPMLGKIDPSSGRLSPSQQSVVNALRKSVRREKDPGGVKKGDGEVKKGHDRVKNTFTEWA